MLNELVIGGMPEGVTEQVIQVPASEVPESEISVEISSEPLYCLCQEPWDIHNRKFMIHCDHCSDWFHGACVGITEIEARDIEKYHCPKCEPGNGPSVLVDYTTKKAADKRRIKSLRCTPEFIAKLKDYKFHIPDEVVLKMRGQSLTLPWLISKGFNRPIFVESTDALGMKLPPESFTVRDVERYVGSDRMVDVIDVERQSDTLMSMQEFAEYFTSPSRSKLLNLISLEFSKTNLSKLVEAPAVTRKLDWVSNFWPASQPSSDEDIIQRPAVSKYCLISAKDSYTDFHIDFGGTSVWYHVLWGEKIFYFIEPSEANLNIYKRWMEGEMGENCFLADEIPICFRCVLKKGQTLLIPTGWIHAVYTPEDSLVFGGNFLHLLNMDLQLQIYDIEKQLLTPSKYLFPSFEASHWFAAEGLLQDFQTLNSTSYVPSYLIKGLKSLIHALKIWLSEKDVGKVRREYIPGSINCKKIIHDLCKELRSAEKRLITKESHSAPKELEFHPPSFDMKLKDMYRRESNSTDNGTYSVTSSREGSPTHGNPNPLRITIRANHSIKEVASVNPPSSGRLKLKFKKNSVTGHTSSEESRPSSPIPFPKDIKEPRVKIRLSLSEGKAESIDYDSNTGSDALHIAESDQDVNHSDNGLIIDVNKHRGHKKHHHKKSKKNKQKHKLDQNKAINDVLAGTLDGLEELFESSNYSERISQCENTSQAIKDTVAGMAAMKETILPSLKRKKHKRKHVSAADLSDSDESLGGIEKVHQDEDYIYLPLAGSDDDSPRKKSKRGRRREDDESWSPRAKVGQVGARESKSSRVNAKREAVEKGLENASAMLEQAIVKRKLKPVPPSPSSSSSHKSKKSKTASPASTVSVIAATSTMDMDMATKAAILQQKFSTPTTNGSPSVSKKPKKGQATPKQRLGRILKLNKFRY